MRNSKKLYFGIITGVTLTTRSKVIVTPLKLTFEAITIEGGWKVKMKLASTDGGNSDCDNDDDSDKDVDGHYYDGRGHLFRNHPMFRLFCQLLFRLLELPHIYQSHLFQRYDTFARCRRRSGDDCSGSDHRSAPCSDPFGPGTSLHPSARV